MLHRFRFFEDFEVGQEGVTSRRTIGEAAIDTFACITWDYSREHMDRHMAAGTPNGERIAHGLLGSSLVPGLISQSAPQIVGRDVAEAALSGFLTNYRRPIILGDTVKVKWRVSEMADDPTQVGFGVVSTAFELVNQEEVRLYDGTLRTRVRKRTAGDAKLRFQTGTPWEIKRFIRDERPVWFLEDFGVGDGEMTKGRTVTEADVVNFAGLMGDLNPLYTDAVYARESAFGERIVPPMLVFSATFMLLQRDGDILDLLASSRTGSLFGGHPADGATFLAPVRIGDTLRCRSRIQVCRVSRTKPDVGILQIGAQVINQRNEVVQEGFVMLMHPTRAGLSGQAPAGKP